MPGQDDDTDKPHEPTRHKLDEARKKGEIARSTDLTTAAAYGGFLLAALTVGESAVQAVGTSLGVMIDQADTHVDLIFSGKATPVIGGLIGTIAMELVGWLVIPASLALLAVFAQHAFVFAPEKVAPKASRINPVQNAKNKYGPSGLFEFAKSFTKLLLYSFMLGWFLSYRLSEMAGAVHGDPGVVGILLAQMLVEFLMIVAVIAMAIGLIDHVWQRFDHLRRHRMSDREVKDEHKQTEGDPHMKQARRQRATQAASDRMMKDVQDADVVLVNPTHFAVALKWNRLPGSAPVCVAKGVDYIARNIRDCAIENHVPVRQDPPTARALYATTGIGQEIDPAHYRAVAAAIRFAETVRRHARAAR